MDKDQEDKALSPAVDRMDSRFPDVSRGEIEQTVAEVQRDFADSPVRDHIPNLVEHEVRARLSEAHREGSETASSSSDTADPERDGFETRQPS